MIPHSWRWDNTLHLGVNFILHLLLLTYPGSKVHGANMGSIWGRQDPGGPHIGPMNFAIWVCIHIALKTFIYAVLLKIPCYKWYDLFPPLTKFSLEKLGLCKYWRATFCLGVLRNTKALSDQIRTRTRFVFRNWNQLYVSYIEILYNCTNLSFIFMFISYCFHGQNMICELMIHLSKCSPPSWPLVTSSRF